MTNSYDKKKHTLEDYSKIVDKEGEMECCI